MRMISLLMISSLVLTSCDFAKESVKVKPDIEITWLNPVGYYTTLSDSTTFATIEEIKFVAKNSVDSHIEKMVWSYSDGAGNRFFGPFEIPIYLKIRGIVTPEEVDTFILEDVFLPLDTVRSYLSDTSQKIYDAKADLWFIATDDYNEGTYDTATCWFGFYLTP